MFISRIATAHRLRTETEQFNVEEDEEIVMEVETVDPNTSHTTKGASDMHKEHSAVAEVMVSVNFQHPITDRHR